MRRTIWQGFTLAYGLAPDRLVLALFRLIPLAWVRYSDIAFIRQRTADDLREAVFPGRSWYWPHGWIAGRPGFDHAPYVIRTRRRRQVILRLRHSFHYLLRERMGEARAAAHANV